MRKLLVSIITVSYNSSETISGTIVSVASQTYPNIEHIIIDGASTDGTIEIIKSFGHKVSKFLTEADAGIYDAMNKGLKLATGEIIGILNSDDLYIDSNVITQVVDQFERTKSDSLYGDLYYVRKENTDIVVRRWYTKKFALGSFKKGWHPPHPTFFVKKEIYEKHGYFNLEFKLAADFEIMLRFLERYHISTYYLRDSLVKMRLGGATNKNLKNVYCQNIECLKAFRLNGLDVNPVLYPLFRVLPKLLQFIK